ncbi:MAG TPA: hypothetical protein VII59_07915 [Streptosporangiaceae bacterium]
MNLGASLRIWRKWWILSTVLLLATLAGASAALVQWRTYQASSSVILLASPTDARANGGNPYLSFNPSLTLAADAVSREVTAPRTARTLAARGFHDSYTVALAPYTTNTTGSVLLATVTGSGKTAVEQMLRAVTGEISAQLLQLQLQSQQGVPAHNRIRTATLSYMPHATLSVSQTARRVATVAVIGLLLAFGLPIVADGLITRRPARHRDAPSREAAGPLPAR